MEIPSDIIYEIALKLNNRGKIRLLSTAKKFHLWKDTIKFTGCEYINTIEKLRYYSQFTNIMIDMNCFPTNAKMYNDRYGLYWVPDFVATCDVIKIPAISHLTYNFDGALFYRKYFFSTIENVIPDTVTHLTFGHYFNTILTYDTKLGIPNNVTHLDFGYHFNKPIVGAIPDSVTHLTFGYRFNKSIKNGIPNSVTHLTFGHYFDQPIKDAIPNSVTHLTFGNDFDQPIKDTIPNSVTYLTFGNDFDQSIKGAIPSSVTHLIFGRYFNQPIKGAIPSSITHLTFGFYFNRSINNGIPKGVTHLTFGDQFNQSVKGGIPVSVTHLTFKGKFFYGRIPRTVKWLSVDGTPVDPSCYYDI